MRAEVSTTGSSLSDGLLRFQRGGQGEGKPDPRWTRLGWSCGLNAKKSNWRMFIAATYQWFLAYGFTLRSFAT